MLYLLLQHYPVSEEYISKMQNHFDEIHWDCLSKNYKLNWTTELIDKFNKQLNFASLSSNPSVPWSIELIEKYNDKWSWGAFSYNSFLPWSNDFITKFESRLHCHDILPTETLEDFIKQENTSKLIERGVIIKYPPMSIEEFDEAFNELGGWKISKIDWYGWTEEILDSYGNNLHWSELSLNKGLPWSDDLIEKYFNKWDWGALSVNRALPWSQEFIEKYNDKFYLLDLASNIGLRENGVLIDIEKDLDLSSINGFVPYYTRKNSNVHDYTPPINIWDYLSYCPSIKWNEDLILKFSNKWDWAQISKNKSIPWSKFLVEKFFNKLDWSLLSDTLIEYGNLGLIDLYQNKIDWSYVSENPKLTNEIIKKFAHKFDWYALAYNDGIIWDNDLINYLMKNYYEIKKMSNN